MLLTITNCTQSEVLDLIETLKSSYETEVIITSKGAFIECTPKVVEETTVTQVVEATKTPKTPKAKTTKTAKTPKATKTATSSKITSYERFKEEVLSIYTRLNTEYNLHHLVPIYRLRREIGDRTTRTEFNNWLLQMQSEDIFQLMAGEMPGITPDKREDSLTIPDVGFRYYTQLLNR